MSKEAIKLDHLRYFLAAVETGSFAAAGEKLNITPSSIAHAVSVIEASLETELLVRRRASGVVPNRHGEAFALSARKTLLEVDSLIDDFRGESEEIKGKLTVGSHESLSWTVIPYVMEHLHLQHPKLRLDVKGINISDGFGPIEEGEVDLLLTYSIGQIDSSKLHVETLARPKAFYMLRKGHPALEKATDRGLTAYDTADYPHIFIDDGMAFALQYNFYAEKGLDPQILMLSNLTHSVNAIVGKTDAVADRMVRPTICETLLGDPIVCVGAADADFRPNIVVATLTRSSAKTVRATEAFIKLCRQGFAQGAFDANFFFE